MDALTALEIGSFRTDLASVLPDRCTVERDASQEGGTDPFGHPLPPAWEPYLADLPCSLWAPGDADPSEDPVERHHIPFRLAVPAGTDLRPTDRVVSVLDAAGLEVLDRPARVDSVTPFPTHVEATLTEATW